MSPVESCVACGGAAHCVLHRIREYTIEQCASCGLARTRGAAFEFAELYDRAYFVGAEAKGYNDYFALAPALARTNRTRLRRLRRMVPAARRLLDVGCGPGFFLREARAGGLSASGLEVSPFAAAYGRDEFGLHIVEGLLNEEHLSNLATRYDLITLWDVIEHLPDPGGAVRLLADRLSPAGLLTLSTGDVRSLAARACGRRWHLYNLPEHLWFFTEESLRKLLERAGLIVERMRREVCWYTARYVLDRLCYSLGRSPLRLPGIGLLEKLSVPCSLFDIITVHARKPVGHAIACHPVTPARQPVLG